jgi:hypothetical protein
MSAVLQYFERNSLKEKAYCTLCKPKKELAYKGSSTKGLWDHLKHHHFAEYNAAKNSSRKREVDPEGSETDNGPLQVKFIHL